MHVRTVKPWSQNAALLQDRKRKWYGLAFIISTCSTSYVNNTKRIIYFICIYKHRLIRLQQWREIQNNSLGIIDHHLQEVRAVITYIFTIFAAI